ncbi:MULTISPECIES: hypothetical protein [unclassified Nocardioides]|uniref:hypothetical protein n=1 Tax=unclassified Nocardioides TaxID=2615069 RepID=UPI000B329E95|nr:MULTISPECIES: hypothetical protein [unclassified Nocardioides]
MSQEQPRPGHATLAGSLIIGGSIIVVLSAWERISTLHTLEAQEELQRVLADPPMSGLGLTADSLASLIQVLCLIGAGSAAAAAILGFQVFKRSTSARLALTLLAPLLLVGGMATAGFLAPMVVFGIVLLWLRPTRDWYAGRPWVQAYEARRAEKLGLRPPGPAAEWPPPVAPVAPAAPAAPEGAATPADAPAAATSAPAHRPAVVRRTRPQALVAACALTWISCSLVLLGIGLMMAVLPSQAEDFFAEVTREQPKMVETYQLTENSLLAAMYVVLVGFALWAVAAIVLAGLAFIGQNWARIILVISAVTGALLLVVMAIGAWPLLALVGVFGATAWMLLRPEVGRWYQR